MALTLFAQTSFNSSGIVRSAPRWEEPTVVLHDVDNGNILGSSVTVTNALDAFPTVSVTHDPASVLLGSGGWRHFMFGVSGVEGKKPAFIMTRSDKDQPTFISSLWRPLHTQDYSTWITAPEVNLVGGDTGTIEWSFTDPFPSGTSYVSSNRFGTQSEAEAFATTLLTTHSSVASPNTSADVNGVYNTTQNTTNHNGTTIGGLDQYAFKLDWGGSSNDGHPKRQLVATYGIHAAGEAQAWPAFKAFIEWTLNDTSTEAIAFRANWIVHAYFNLNANGVKGGSHRHFFDSATAANRAWTTPPAITVTAETAAVQAAIITDTGGQNSTQVMLNFHGDVHTQEAYGYFVNSNDLTSPSAEHAALTTEVDALMTPTNVPHVTSNDTTNDASFGRSYLGAVSFDPELTAMYSTDQSYYDDVGEIWGKAVAAADALGTWNTSITLTVADMTHSHSVDNVSLTQANILSVNDVSHSHSLNNITLTTAINLVVSDLSHNHSLDNIDLVQANVLTVNAITHAHSIDNIALSTGLNLVVANIIHNQLLDNTSLTQANTLAINEILHGHALDNVSLSQANILSIDELNHSHAVDNVTLNTSVNLSVGDILHGHSLDGVTLTQSQVLEVQELLHSHVTEGSLTLLTDLILSVGSMTHAHTLENVSWAVLVTPSSRIYLVEAENHIYLVQ